MGTIYHIVIVIKVLNCKKKKFLKQIGHFFFFFFVEIHDDDVFHAFFF